MDGNVLQPFADAPLPALTRDSRLGRTSEAAFQRLEDELVIVLPMTRTLHALNATGRLLWEALSAPRTVGELADLLVREYEVDPERAERDATAWAAELKRQRVLVDA